MNMPPSDALNLTAVHILPPVPFFTLVVQIYMYPLRAAAQKRRKGTGPLRLRIG